MVTDAALASLEQDKADKATTLAGYGITDAYTKTETDSNIAAAVEHKADQATTLAGYGITDAYTKEETNAQIAALAGDLEAQLEAVFHYKGSVTAIGDLPEENQIIGDVYNVEESGANYAWNGSAWDKLSETIDLSPFLTIEAFETEQATNQEQFADIAEILSTKADAESVYTKEEIDELFAGIPEYTAGDGIQIDDYVVSVENRTVERITAENGNESRIFNGEDGAGARFINPARHTEAFVGTDQNDVAIYVTNQQTNQGSRIRINPEGAFYTVTTTPSFTSEDEILTKRALQKMPIMETYDTFEEFPETGVPGRLYVDSEENFVYRWDDPERKYVLLYGNTISDPVTDEEIDNLF